MRFPDALFAMSLGLMASIGSGPATAAEPSKADVFFTNPLLLSGPDPWVTKEGADYYYMHTLGDRLAIWKTRDLSQLDHAEQKTIWKPPASGPNSRSIWAPELHRIEGKWYVYYTAVDAAHDDDDHRGVFVLENSSPDPLSGECSLEVRMITTTRSPGGTLSPAQLALREKLQPLAREIATYQRLLPESTGFGPLIMSDGQGRIGTRVAVFAVGPGVCVWLALSELMPTRIRSNGMSIALLVNQAVSTAIAATFLPTVSKYGYSTMFWAFAGCTVIYFVTAAFLLPETKGKTLEEIEEHFEKGRAARSA